VTFEKVRQVALKLPDVEEGTAYGFPAFRVKKKMFLCFREDLGAVLMHAPFDQRDAMQPCCRICCRWRGSMRRR
jgi:hypothetical protein